MSPIVLRPVREQFEHDRVIRALTAKYRRRFDVAANVGSERTTAVGPATMGLFPDLLLYTTERGRRLAIVVEIETAASVNSLEALAEWAPLGRLRVPLVLYLPIGMTEVARRLCAEHGVRVLEIWAYHYVGDQLRFACAYRAPAPPERSRRHPARTRSHRAEPHRARRPAASRRTASAQRLKGSRRKVTTRGRRR